MKSTYRIVTKSRYSLLRVSLLFIAFTIEYWLCLGFDFAGQLASGVYSQDFVRFVCSFIGYIMLHILFVFRTHSKKVYVKYEFGLSLMIKCVAIDAVVFFFFGATGFSQSIWELIGGFVILTILNVITIVLVLMCVNWVAKIMNRESERMLYVGPEDVISDGCVDGYDAVYLRDIPAQQRNDWLKLCYEKELTVYTTAKLSDILIRTSGLAQDKDQPVFYCTKFGIGAATAALKRLFDITCSLIALFVLWPIMLVTAIVIKVQDGGPALYTQIRCTKDLKQFKIYKFRSMIMESEEESGARLSCADDDRVTPFGRFIRKWKIDELPQLFNILKGDMSIVGPRPERPELIEENCKLVPEFVLRTKVRAGLTGYAQIRGAYETDKLDKLKWDLIYIENYSLLLDIKIIIITAIMLFKKKF